MGEAEDKSWARRLRDGLVASQYAGGGGRSVAAVVELAIEQAIIEAAKRAKAEARVWAERDEPQMAAGAASAAQAVLAMLERTT